MAAFKTKVMQGQGFWTLEVRTLEGLCLYYRYDNLPQARYFAAVFELGPISFPTPFKTYFRSPKRGRTSRANAVFAKSA